MEESPVSAPGLVAVGAMAARGPAPLRLHAVLASLLMMACLGAALWMRPTVLLSSRIGEPDLQALVPRSFGDWTMIPGGAAALINPQQAESSREIYTATLGRTYWNRKTGRVLMLSLAYGRDQTRDTQLHRPEMCYGGNGFRIESLEPVDLPLPTGGLQATRMLGVLGVRREAATYLVRFGDTNVRGSLQMNLTRMRFAAQGFITDGLLLRVSEVTRAPLENTFAVQDAFLRSLLAELPEAARAQLVGQRRF